MFDLYGFQWGSSHERPHKSDDASEKLVDKVSA